MAKFATFDEFWRHYLNEHADPRTRDLHFAGTAAALMCFTLWLTTGRIAFVAVALVAGYLPAWIAHLGIERNTPATFTHPLWSLRADLRMFRLWLIGSLDHELARAGLEVRRADHSR